MQRKKPRAACNKNFVDQEQLIKRKIFQEHKGTSAESQSLSTDLKWTLLISRIWTV